MTLAIYAHHEIFYAIQVSDAALNLRLSMKNASGAHYSAQMMYYFNNVSILFKDGLLGMIICAKGRMDSLEQNDSNVHPLKADSKRFEANPIIQKCLHLKLSSLQIIKFYSELSGLEKRTGWPNLIQDFFLGDDPNVMKGLKFLGMESNHVHVSLLNDFLTRPHQCLVSQSDHRSLISG